ncbi:MAG: HAMP domain-containing protein, partial [Candidatus Omnitrophota bacterium]
MREKKGKKIISIRRKAVILALLLGTLITSASNYYVISKASKVLFEYKLERMDDLCATFAMNSEHAVLLQDKTNAEKICHNVTKANDVLFALIFDQDGNIVAGNYAALPAEYYTFLKNLLTAEDRYIREGRIPSEINDPFEDSDVIIKPIYSGRTELTFGGGLLDYQSDDEKDIIGVTAIVFSLKSITEFIRKVRLVITGVSLLFLALIVTLFSLLLNMLIRHLKTLVKATARLGSGDLTARVDIRQNDEIGELAKAFNKMAEEVEKKNKDLRTAVETIKTTSMETIYRLSIAAEHRDSHTGEHLLRISHYAEAIARRLGLEDKIVEAILYASLMHDVGKIGIPDSILM